jgi:hypothetical protein
MQHHRRNFSNAAKLLSKKPRASVRYEALDGGAHCSPSVAMFHFQVARHTYLSNAYPW